MAPVLRNGFGIFKGEVVPSVREVDPWSRSFGAGLGRSQMSSTEQRGWSSGFLGVRKGRSSQSVSWKRGRISPADPDDTQFEFEKVDQKLRINELNESAASMGSGQSMWLMSGHVARYGLELFIQMW